METSLDLCKRREELLRRKEELARKLKHADRQRQVKRRKVKVNSTGSLPSQVTKVPGLPLQQHLYTLPFSFTPTSFFKTSYAVTFDPWEKVKTCRFVEAMSPLPSTSITSDPATPKLPPTNTPGTPLLTETSQSKDSKSSFSSSVYHPGSIVIQTNCHIYIVNALDCYVYPCQSEYRGIWVNVCLLPSNRGGSSSRVTYRVFGIATRDNDTCVLEEVPLGGGGNQEVISFNPGRFLCCHVTNANVCYLGVMQTDTSSVIHIIHKDEGTQTAKTKASIDCKGAAISSLYPCNESDLLLGCCHSNVYIWSRITLDMVCDLHLPGYPDPLIVHSALSHNSHLLVTVRTGATVYSLVLDGTKFTEQKLVAEVSVPRDATVFGCGLYLAFTRPETGVVEFYNTMKDALACRVTLAAGEHVTDVARDVPVLLLRTTGSDSVRAVLVVEDPEKG